MENECPKSTNKKCSITWLKKWSNNSSINNAIGGDPVAPLETLLGYKFRDKNLLLKALTPNHVGERLFEDKFNYQILEFQVNHIHTY